MKYVGSYFLRVSLRFLGRSNKVGIAIFVYYGYVYTKILTVVSEIYRYKFVNKYIQYIYTG